MSVRQASTAATQYIARPQAAMTTFVLASHLAFGTRSQAGGYSTPLPPADVRHIDALADRHRIPLVGAHTQR